MQVGRWREARWTGLICASVGASVGKEVKSLLEGSWLFQWPAATGMTIHTSRLRPCTGVHALARLSSLSPFWLLAGMCMCQAWKSAAKNPRAGWGWGRGSAHWLCNFSPSPHSFFFSLCLSLFFWTRAPGGQSHEGLSVPAKSFQRRGTQDTLQIHLNWPGSKELVKTCIGC